DRGYRGKGGFFRYFTKYRFIKVLPHPVGAPGLDQGKCTVGMPYQQASRHKPMQATYRTASPRSETIRQSA
ncbi:MAG: hypothetical protein RLZ70_1267, partial [Verrucomicrobiota bacterium]